MRKDQEIDASFDISHLSSNHARKWPEKRETLVSNVENRCSILVSDFHGIEEQKKTHCTLCGLLRDAAYVWLTNNMSQHDPTMLRYMLHLHAAIVRSWLNAMLI